MTITVALITVILWSIVCAVLGGCVSAIIVSKDWGRYYSKKLRDTEDLLKEAIQQANNWRHWTNVYRRLLDESEKRNTIIINEQPKGANIPKFGD